MLQGIGQAFLFDGARDAKSFGLVLNRRIIMVESLRIVLAGQRALTFNYNLKLYAIEMLRAIAFHGFPLLSEPKLNLVK